MGQLFMTSADPKYSPEEIEEWADHIMSFCPWDEVDGHEWYTAETGRRTRMYQNVGGFCREVEIISAGVMWTDPT